MKVIIDINLSPVWQASFLEAGIAAAHWAEIGAVDALDSDIMDYARADDAVVLTHDLDFSAILAATKQDKPSVIQLRAEDTSPEANARVVIAALHRCGLELEQDALITVQPSRFRLTMLPLDR